MARRKGGSKAEAGFYWRAGEWEIVTLSGTGGILPGEAREAYTRIPTWAMLLAAPIMGALFVVFLPFIGFAIVLRHLAGLALTGAKRTALAVGATLVPAWRPGEAYFAHRNGEEPEAEADEAPPTLEADALDEVERQIAERRGR